MNRFNLVLSMPPAVPQVSDEIYVRVRELAARVRATRFEIARHVERGRVARESIAALEKREVAEGVSLLEEIKALEAEIDLAARDHARCERRLPIEVDAAYRAGFAASEAVRAIAAGFETERQAHLASIERAHDRLEGLRRSCPVAPGDWQAKLIAKEGGAQRVLVRGIAAELEGLTFTPSEPPTRAIALGTVEHVFQAGTPPAPVDAAPAKKIYSAAEMEALRVQRKADARAKVLEEIGRSGGAA